ncbi:MAG: DUF4124 domain-containing protein [Pseudomonadota bacterium]
MIFSMRLLMLFILTALLYAPAINAAVYKWVDEKGVTQYSDKPTTGKKSQTVEIAPSPPKEETDNALQRKQLQLDEDRLKTEQKRQTELKDAAEKQKNIKSKYKEGGCSRKLTFFCEGEHKSIEYLDFCIDINKYYLIDNCEEPLDLVIEKTQVIYKACENDYGKKCIRPTDRHYKEGVECLAHNQKHLSAECLHQTKSLFRHFTKEERN